MALSVPVTDNAHGDTKELRAKLALPTEPKLEHVVDHMLKMAAANHLETLSKQSQLATLLVKDAEQAYHYIINSVSWGDPELPRVTGRLAREPWVLVQGCKFVRPSELCFDLEEDTHYGKLRQ